MPEFKRWRSGICVFTLDLTRFVSDVWAKRTSRRDCQIQTLVSAFPCNSDGCTCPGEQVSHRIGEAIARGDYKAAVKMLLRSQGENRARLKQVGDFDHVPGQQGSRKPSAYMVHTCRSGCAGI